MIGEEYRKRLAINNIVSSKYIGFYRLCGKDLQKKYRKANASYNNPNREELLNEIIEVYYKTLENKQPKMDDRELNYKKKLIMRYAKKHWGK